MFQIRGDRANFEIRTVDRGIFRVRASSDSTFGESLLSRYNILQEKGEVEATVSENGSVYSVQADPFTAELDAGANRITFSGAKAPFTVEMEGKDGAEYRNKGFQIKISVCENERFFGIGDESRKSIARKGTTARMDIKNVVSYGPVPFLMSSNGWGFLLNCTYAHMFDIADTEKDKIVVSSPKGVIDFYVFMPESHDMRDVLELHSRVSGKPIVMPKFFYGFTFVLNEQTNAREMLWDCKMFRREDIPCDTVGLEPQWMSRHYDASIDKKFDDDRFYIPGWLPQNQSGPFTFFYNLRELGFKLSLWLCNDYDLLWEEERQAGARAALENKEYSYEGASIVDPHFSCPLYMDGRTKRDEGWFEHLKKFVDNGASAFKLDGAFQVNDHPDRLWGGKYFDDEVHNVYPVLYVKQMQEGFRDHTDGRRSVIYTPCVYSGSQRYCASWAGDTGGGYDTVVAMLNFGLSGHVNVTCDLDPTEKTSIHYGFFAPWVQQLGWRNWHQPWFLSDDKEEMIRFYSKLRSSLFPYIYATAHQAAETALPIARALSLMYPDHPEYDALTNMYLFGDSLLVGVFDMHVTLPEGRWIDFWNDKVYEGGCDFGYEIPEGRGGALFVKAGSVIAMMEPQPYIEKAEPDRYFLHIYPGGDSVFTLVEDDGYTYDYEKGGMAKTRISLYDSKDGCSLSIAQRVGAYAGREKRTGDAYKESDPEIRGMGEVSGFTAVVHAAGVKSVTLGGKEIPVRCEDGKYCFDIPAALHAESELTYQISLH